MLSSNIVEFPAGNTSAIVTKKVTSYCLVRIIQASLTNQEKAQNRKCYQRFCNEREQLNVMPRICGGGL